VSPADRQAERRTLLVRAAFGLFGDGSEAAVSVRSVCRAAELNTRYFYESFTDTDALLGAVYDVVAGELGSILTDVMTSTRDERSRLRAGIRAVLDFSSADPRRGKILFTEARTNPVLAARRTIAQDHVRELVLDEQRRTAPESDRVATEVGAAMYAGAMAELAQQWLAGTLGDDVDAVVAHAVRLLLPN
jgi:AcrR family transcriptional regulator